MVNHEVIDSLFQYNSYIISDSRALMNSAQKFLSQIDEKNGLSRTADILQLLNLFNNTKRKNEGEKKLNPFLHKIIGWTESSFPQQITLDDAASAVNLSRYHFSRKFKAHTGSTYMKFLMKLRLENSLHQLNREGLFQKQPRNRGFPIFPISSKNSTVSTARLPCNIKRIKKKKLGISVPAYDLRA